MPERRVYRDMIFWLMSENTLRWTKLQHHHSRIITTKFCGPCMLFRYIFSRIVKRVRSYQHLETQIRNFSHRLSSLSRVNSHLTLVSFYLNMYDTYIHNQNVLFCIKIPKSYQQIDTKNYWINNQVTYSFFKINFVIF